MSKNKNIAKNAKSDTGKTQKPIAVKLYEFNKGSRNIPPTKKELAKLEKEKAVAFDLEEWPADFTDNEKQVWKKLVPELKKVGLITTIDVPAFKRYCHHLKKYKEIEDLIEKTPPVITIYAGRSPQEVARNVKPRIKSVRPNPLYSRYDSLSQLLLKYERNFGMTPAARTCLDIEAEKENTEFEDFINRRKRNE